MMYTYTYKSHRTYTIYMVISLSIALKCLCVLVFCLWLCDQPLKMFPYFHCRTLTLSFRAALSPWTHTRLNSIACWDSRGHTNTHTHSHTHTHSLTQPFHSLSPLS